MSWHFCYFTFMPGYWFGQAILQNRVSEVDRWSNFWFPLVMFFPTKTFQVPDKFPSQSSIQSLSSKFTPKGLTRSFPAAPASVNSKDMKKPSGSVPVTVPECMVLPGTTQTWPRPVITFFQLSQYKPLLLLASSQHRPACGRFPHSLSRPTLGH